MHHEKLQYMTSTMAEALGLPSQGLLSIIGAGGKTTAMFRLAKELVERKRRVICSTTTKIFRPSSSQARLVLAKDNKHVTEECSRIVDNGEPACVVWAAEGNKLLGLPPDFLHHLFDSGICDWILVEADGARRLPLKVPAASEPVIPERSTHVLAIIGLTAIGTPLDEDHVCRSQRYAELSGLSAGQPISPESVAAVCAHPEGAFKGTPQGATHLLWLNQADTPHAPEHGRLIIKCLHRANAMPHRVCIGATAYAACVMEVYP